MAQHKNPDIADPLIIHKATSRSPLPLDRPDTIRIILGAFRNSNRIVDLPELCIVDLVSKQS